VKILRHRVCSVRLPAFATTAAATSTTSSIATAATPTATSVTAAAPATTTATPVAFRACFVDGNRAAVDIGAVESFNRGMRLVVVAHRNEGESAWPTRVAICDHGDLFDLTMGPKLCLQRFLGRGKGKVANIQLHRAQLQNTEPASPVAGLSEAGTSEIGCTKLPRLFFDALQGHQTHREKKHTRDKYIETFHKGLTNLVENANKRQPESLRADRNF
jgi:hypothetical protein